MASSSSSGAAHKSHRHAQTDDHGGGGGTPFSRRSLRQNSSLSSSPSFSSNDSSNGPFDSPVMSPFTTTFSGVPFSWERIPGKPKSNDQAPRKEELLLPLPPSSNHSSFRKSSKEVVVVPETAVSPRRDPFLAALVKCSKEDLHRRGDVIGRYWKGPSSKVAEKNTLSDRFGFVNMYASCKRTCAVSESIVFLPRSRRYDLISRR